MENEVFEKDLSIRSTIGSNDFVRGVDAEGRSINYKRSAFSAPSSLTGLAKLTTKPGTPQENDLWFCLETGVYTFFDNITAEAGNYLAYKDSAWFLVDTTPLGYSIFDNIDPETLPIPSGGTVYIGSYQSKLWQKLNSGEILWYDSEKVSEDKQKFLAIAQGVEMNFRDSLLDEGGIYYSNEGLALIAKLLESNLYKKANLIVTPAGTKVGTGAGDGILYSVKGSNFTVDRAAKKSYTDIDGYIRFVVIDEATIDYSNGVAVINNAVASSNQVLYPFSYVNNYWSKSGVKVELDPTTAGSDIFQPFSTIGGGWTDNGDGTYTCDGTTNTAMITPDLTHSTGVYLIEFTITSDNSGKLYISSSSLFGQTVQINDGSAGVKRIYLDDVGSVDYFRIITNSSSGWDGTIGNFSIKKVLGFDSPFKDSSDNVINIAEKVVEDTNTGSHRLYKTFSVTSGVTTTSIVIAKYNGRNIMIRNSQTNVSVVFDLQNGAVLDHTNSANYIDSGIKELANGYYLCYIVTDITDSGTLGDYYVYLTTGTTIDSGFSYTGDGTSGVYLSGSQFEEQSEPTPFINDPADAEGNVVSRSRDKDLSSGITTNYNNFAIIMEYRPVNLNDNMYWSYYTDGDNHFDIGYNKFANTLTAGAKIGGTSYFMYDNTEYDEDFHKVGLLIDNLELKMFVDGNLIATKTIPSTISPTNIMNNFGGLSNYFDGDIKSYLIIANVNNNDVINLTK